jgi:ribosomal protein S18 acetylase RimI-like enzyme
VADVQIVPATPERWADLETVFGARGDPSWCWCQYFLTTGRSYEESAERNHDALRRELRSDREGAVGLLAYRDGEPVGWVQLGPRSAFPRVTGSTPQQVLLADTDPRGAWRVTCFVVRIGHRRSGIATALLAAAVEHARAAGATTLEGNPVDLDARSNPRVGGAVLYPGVLTTFLGAGFRELGRTVPTRPVVVLDL